jgi:hypothetical protein
VKDEYISISEFAKRAGVSRPTIYSKLESELSSFCKVVKGKKVINIAALSLFGVKESVNNFTDNETLKALVTVLQEQQETLQKELDIKNRQIDTLNAQNSQQLKLIDQQQQLQALAERKRIEAPAERIKEEKGLLNREKFSTRTEYAEYLRRLLPQQINSIFAGRKAKQELDKVLELMSEEERGLLKENPRIRETIETLEKRDFDKYEQDMREAEEESRQMRKVHNRAMEKVREELQREKEEFSSHIDGD